MKPIPCLVASSSSASALAGGQVVEVLHRHNLRDLLRGVQLVDVDLRQPDVADLAFLLQLDQLTDLVFERELVVDAVQLKQVDGVDAEPAQTQFRFLAQIGREAQRNPHVGPGAQQSRFGGDDQPVVGMQRLADDLFGEVGAVGVRGVDEVDAEFGRPPQHADRFVPIGRRAPNALAGQTHCAVAEAVDREIAAESERSGCLSGSLGSHLADRTPAGKNRPRPRGKLGRWICRRLRSCHSPIRKWARPPGRFPRATSTSATRPTSAWVSFASKRPPTRSCIGACSGAPA